MNVVLLSNLCFCVFSELPASLSLPSAQSEGASKRSGSPSILDVDNKHAKRIRCISSENESNINGKTNFSIEVGIIFFHNTTMLIHRIFVNC